MTMTLKNGSFICQAVTLNALIPYALHQYFIPFLLSPQALTYPPPSPLSTDDLTSCSTENKRKEEKKKETEFILPYLLTH